MDHKNLGNSINILFIYLFIQSFIYLFIFGCGGLVVGDSIYYWWESWKEKLWALIFHRLILCINKQKGNICFRMYFGWR